MEELTINENLGEESLEPEEQKIQESLDTTLRPQQLEDFVGQSHIKDPLSISMVAAQSRREPIEHVLLYGNPGLGKTTLAGIVASEMGAQIRITAGPALDRVADLAAILSNLSSGDILFIDEIHRINRSIEEILYTAMEDFAIDIIVGKGPTARTMRLPVEPFTLIGATTKLNMLSSPLRDRFGHVYHLNFYKNDEINKIMKRNAGLLDLSMHDEAAKIISARSRQTPRVANRLLRRVRDYAQVKSDGILSAQTATDALHMLKVDTAGLDHIDRKILRTINTNFQGGPVGLSTLAAAIAEDMDTVETIYEPYLLQIGMLERTARGRKLTAAGRLHLESIHKDLL